MSIDAKMKRIIEAAEHRQWHKARQAAEDEAQASQDPSLIMAAAMLHICTEDLRGAKQRFVQARSVDSTNGLALFMLYLIDWMQSRPGNDAYREQLLALDWRSAHEFYGYLTQILEKRIALPAGPQRGYSARENSWLHYIEGLQARKQGNASEAQTSLEAAVLAADGNSWVYYLALSALDRIRENQLALLEPSDRKRYVSAIADFEHRHFAVREKRLADRDELGVLTAKLNQKSILPEERRKLLRRLREIDPENVNLIVAQVFLDLMVESWNQALNNAHAYLAFRGRENQGRLQIGLLAPEILHKMGSDDAARQALIDFRKQTVNDWYRRIAATLLGTMGESALLKAAAGSPECVLTARTALGFWAEGIGDANGAVLHYREALGSYMDEMPEYEFAVRRIQSLRRPRSD